MLELLLLVVLYSRLAPARVLENATRREILRRISNDPGRSSEALAREMGLVRSTVVHHVVVLRRHSLLVCHRAGRVLRLYPRGIVAGAESYPALALLADPTRRAIVRRLVSSPATTDAIAAELGLARRLVAYHLAKLRAAGLAERRGWPHRFHALPQLGALLAQATSEA